MPESEALKIVLQLGSFGLLGYAVIWILRTGGPMIHETIRDLAASHQQTENNLLEKLEFLANKLESQGREQTVQVTQIVAEQTRLVQHMDANCREERIQLAKMLAAAPPIKT